MKSFYRAVIKYLQKIMPIEETLLKVLTCLNPEEQKGYNSLQHCRVVAREIPSVQPEEKIIAGDEWIRYQEFEVTDDDLKCRTDKYWHKIFSRRDDSGDNFVVLPNMVKCFLSLCHSNADVERSFSTNKRMLTKQNMALNEKTIIGCRDNKAVVEECEGVNKVPVTQDLLKVATNSHRPYTEHLREENAKKRQNEAAKPKQEAYKRNPEEIKTEEKSLHEKLEQLNVTRLRGESVMDMGKGIWLKFNNLRETLIIFAPNGNIWGHMTPMTSQMMSCAHK